MSEIKTLEFWEFGSLRKIVVDNKEYTPWLNENAWIWYYRFNDFRMSRFALIDPQGNIYVTKEVPPTTGKCERTFRKVGKIVDEKTTHVIERDWRLGDIVYCETIMEINGKIVRSDDYNYDDKPQKFGKIFEAIYKALGINSLL